MKIKTYVMLCKLHHDLLCTKETHSFVENEWHDRYCQVVDTKCKNPYFMSAYLVLEISAPVYSFQYS